MSISMIKKIDVAAALILNERNEVLLQKKDAEYPWFPNKWCMFGGWIELNEEPKNALDRELLEELGLAINDLSFYKKERYQDTCHLGTREGDYFIYQGKFSGDISEIHLKEGAGFAFFSKDELNSINLVYHNRRIIGEFFAKADF